ncbi:MAG: biopolymer transporter ExbD, partial [Candidatus Goldbacteria bacterium]|nr:biopolymer transporter ExbD [Candidatus Goldiibacteriota bacterium]
MHGGSSRQEGEGITNINVVPLIDICLVLLIIFMVTSPMVI